MRGLSKLGKRILIKTAGGEPVWYLAVHIYRYLLTLLIFFVFLKRTAHAGLGRGGKKKEPPADKRILIGQDLGDVGVVVGIMSEHLCPGTLSKDSKMKVFLADKNQDDAKAPCAVFCLPCR